MNSTEIIIQDMRPSFGTQLMLKNDKVYFNGSPFQELIKDETSVRDKHFYNVIQYGTNVCKIALKDDDFKAINDILNPIDFTRVSSDVNGNPRFVFHFLNLVNDKDREQTDGNLDKMYAAALKKAKQIGGRKFHNKQYGGGIAIQMYAGEDVKMSQIIKELNK